MISHKFGRWTLASFILFFFEIFSTGKLSHDKMLLTRYVSFEESGDKVPDFGQGMRKEVKLDFDSSRALCNQGSFGVCPKRVVDYKLALFEEMESNPDKFFRLKLRTAFDESLRSVSRFLGSDFGNLVFVTNVTTALNVAFKSVEPLMPEMKESHLTPKILMTPLKYNSTGFMAEQLAKRTGAEIVFADVDFPIASPDDAVDRFRKACLANPGVVLAVVDHISSSSAVFWPLEKIVRTLKGLGVKQIIVDGAHAPGQVLDLNLEHLGKCGVDFYAANLHKWAMAPRGCGVLWCRPGLQDQVMPHNTSHLHYQTYQDRFFEQGTLDHSNYLAAKAGLSFMDSIGGMDAIHSYCVPLLDWAQTMMAKALGTESLAVPESMQAPFMRCIALPECPGFPPCTYNSSWQLSEEVLAASNVAQYITTFGGRFWIRISAGIYSTKDDYLALTDALVDLCERNK